MIKQHEIAHKYLWLLLLYGILAFFVFCLVLLPTEEVGRQALHLLSQRLNYTFSTKELQVKFPGILELKNVTIAQKNSRADAFPFLKIDSIQIRPRLSQIFFKKLAILFNLRLYQGTIDSGATFDLLHPLYLREFNCFGRGIHLASLKQLPESFNVHINGDLSGQAKVKMEKNDLLTLAGDYHFEVAPGDVQVMSFPEFNFRQIKGEGSVSQGKVRINSVRVQGDDLQAQMTGDVRLDQDLVKSYLKARVNLTIGQEFKDKLGPLASFLPRQEPGGIQLNIKGNLNNLSFMPM